MGICSLLVWSQFGTGVPRLAARLEVTRSCVVAADVPSGFALAKTIPVAWRAVDGELRLAVGDDVVPRREAAALLREAGRQAAAERLYRLPHQGKVMQTVGDQRVSNHYMYRGSFTRFAEWLFVHRARLGLVPLNGVRRSPVRGDERCRRCGYARETLSHVLCHCMPHSDAFQRRHNAILSRLHKAVQRDGVVTQVNRRVPGCVSSLRPDLVVTRGDEVILADVTVAFENGPHALRAASDAKVRKYTPLVHELRGRGKTASVVALIVGPLGTWWRGNEASLRRLRVSRNYAKLMRRLMAETVCCWRRQDGGDDPDVTASG
ncbi:uncharacterized protein LOC119094916 [Pollicipes pollicipes]|uniref:uncharacterized protein LOC119094916 n=1 Tax=Pollicipes pollicipes TaxID=41117 RepID=UPI0018849463|nr:uncharacterized protein LOC119094916 [Pollicipes pollicipes]